MPNQNRTHNFPPADDSDPTDLRGKKTEKNGGIIGTIGRMLPWMAGHDETPSLTPVGSVYTIPDVVCGVFAGTAIDERPVWEIGIASASGRGLRLPSTRCRRIELESKMTCRLSEAVGDLPRS